MNEYDWFLLSITANQCKNLRKWCHLNNLFPAATRLNKWWYHPARICRTFGWFHQKGYKHNFQRLSHKLQNLTGWMMPQFQPANVRSSQSWWCFAIFEKSQTTKKKAWYGFMAQLNKAVSQIVVIGDLFLDIQAQSLKKIPAWAEDNLVESISFLPGGMQSLVIH